MSASTGMFKNEITSLSPEILLKIFLNLDSHEIVILRSVCKEFLEVIDNNKSLWRVLDWIQQEEESPIPALEMFDEKSASTIKEVSIFQSGELDDERLLEVLRRSSQTLTHLSLHVNIGEPLKTFSSNLSTSTIKQPPSSVSLELGGGLGGEVRCLFSRLIKLDVSSLVSFADLSYQNSPQLRSIISNFSQTIIHLSISPLTAATPQAVSCPALRILEGRFPSGFPSWLEAPNLQIVIASLVSNKDFFLQLPVSVEEIWLLSWDLPPANKDLDFLSKVCPKLKILKLGKDVFEKSSTPKRNLDPFSAREAKVQEGVEIEGIRMRSLEKLIVPTDLFVSAQLDEMREIVGEVIDMEDYPDFIELEY